MCHHEYQGVVAVRGVAQQFDTAGQPPSSARRLARRRSKFRVLAEPAQCPRAHFFATGQLSRSDSPLSDKSSRPSTSLTRSLACDGDIPSPQRSTISSCSRAPSRGKKIVALKDKPEVVEAKGSHASPTPPPGLCRGPRYTPIRAANPEQRQQGGFAAARWPHEQHDLTGRQF